MRLLRKIVEKQKLTQSRVWYWGKIIGMAETQQGMTEYRFTKNVDETRVHGRRQKVRSRRTWQGVAEEEDT